MTQRTQEIVDLLTQKQIAFQLLEHDAVYTIDELLALHLPNAGAVAKNLFVRDDKKRAYFLVVAHGEKKVELKALQQKIGSRRLSFASEADLEAILGLQKGSVTPFGALHDETHRTTVLLDEAFRGGLIGVHPNENTATVWLRTEDLAALLRQHGTAVEFVAV